MRGRTTEFAVTSRGRVLTVQVPLAAGSWWPQISPHLPGVGPGGITTITLPAAADVVIENRMGASDARRLVNAHLHRLHLKHSTLCVHATALHHPGRDAAVMLLGGHGAGKTLVALALALYGWHVLAGDVTLLDCLPHPPVVSGGTTAFIARSASVRRWFPELGLPRTGAATVDLCGLPAIENRGRACSQVLTAVIVVNVDGDPQPSGNQVVELDRHTAATTWLRSSSHLLDRVLDDSGVVLRQFEALSASGRRLSLLRGLADRAPMYSAWGTPWSIAEHVEHLVASSERPHRLPGRRR